MQRNHLFERLIETTVAASTGQVLRSGLGQIARSHGFDRFAYVHVRAETFRAVTNYPKEWEKLYRIRDYVQIDPVIALAKQRSGVFRWSTDGQRKRASQELKTFYDKAADFGIRSGISLAIRAGFGEYAIVTFASAQTLNSLHEHERDTVGAAAAAAFIHAKFIQNRALPAIAKRIRLNSRETACLSWAANGKTMEESAICEGIAYNTVRFHLSMARAKLKAVTLPQATAIATKLRLI